MNHKQIRELADRAVYSCAYSYTLADYNKKGHSVFVKIVELSNLLTARGAEGRFSVAMSPAVKKELWWALNFRPEEFGLNEFGDSKWKVFEDEELGSEVLIWTDPEHVAKLTIWDFVPSLGPLGDTPVKPTKTAPIPAG